MSRLLLLDRDGVLNLDVGYAYRMEQVVWNSDGIELARLATASGWACVIITNQSGIARGRYTDAQFRGLMRTYVSELASIDVRIAATYYCPHHPEFTGECRCRKPNPGMLQVAAQRFGAREVVMVGDQPTDLLAAERAGVRGVHIEDDLGITSLRQEIVRSSVG